MKKVKNTITGMSIMNKIHVALIFFIMIPALILVFAYLKDFSREMYQVQKEYQINQLEAVNRSIMDECTQIMNSLTYLSNMNEVRNYISTPYVHNSQNILRLNYEVSQAFSLVQGINEGVIEQITFYFLDENMPEHGKMFLRAEWLTRDGQMERFLESEETAGWFMNVSDRIYAGMDGSEGICYAYKQTGIKGKMLGVFVIRVKEEQLFRELKEAAVGNEIQLMTTPEEGMVSVYNDAFHQYLCQRLDTSLIQNNIADTTRQILIWVIYGLVLMFFISFGLLKHIFKHMYLMMEAIDQAAHGNFEKKIPIGKSKDIKRIAIQFNHLLDELHAYVDRTVRLEEQKSRAEASALQMQMNPHFFYNGLGIIQVALEEEKKYEMSDAITYLAQILRYNMSFAVFVTMREEADIVSKYIRFVNTFYENKIEYSFETTLELEEVRMPKFILQPLAENAVKYGDGKQIRIRARRNEEGHFHIMVENSGEKLPPADLLRINETLAEVEAQPNGGKIGLKNIAARLRMLYGKDAGIRISCDATVTVHVWFPADAAQDLGRNGKYTV